MRAYGKYRGIVADNNDPQKLRRLRVKVPTLFGPEPLAAWAWPVLRLAGGDYGDVDLPQPGDGVWVEFEAGDPNKPIWDGCWAAAPKGVLEIPAEAKDGYPMVRTHKWPSGFLFLVDERSGAEALVIKDSKSGLRVSLDRVNKKAEVTDGTTVVVLQNGQVQVKTPAGTARYLVDERFLALFNSHTHAGPGLPPDQQAGSGHRTSVLKGE